MNYILLKGTSAPEAKAVVQELATLYHDSGFTQDLQLLQHQETKDLFLLQFSVDPDFERFKYFVNFLAYPFETQHQGKATGFYTVHETSEDALKLAGKRLMLYLPDEDAEGDNVYAVTPENRGYKFGFAVGEEYQELDHPEKQFQELPLQVQHYLLLEKINPDLQKVTADTKKQAGCLPALFLLVAFLLLAYTF